MKESLSRMLRSGVALLLAFCMAAGLLPSAAFAEEAEKINYVSLGDSMTNGYGLPGYDRNAGVEDYGNGSYANQFAEELGANHTQLAMSAMRAEDLHWLLELDYNDADAIALTETETFDEESWNAKFTTGDYWTWDEICTHSRTKAATDSIKAKVYSSFYPELYANGYTNDVALIAKYYQESVKNADVISLGMGNGNFGVFMFGRILEAIGFDGTPDEAMIYKVDRAIAECEPALQAQILNLKDTLFTLVENKIGQPISGNPTLEALANTVVYTSLSFVLNYAGTIEAILQLNPDADIILVELMNTFGGETTSVEGVTLGDLLDVVFAPLNAYIAALPTVMKASGNSIYAHANFYYAEANNIQCMVETYGDDFYLEDGTPNSRSTIRNRFVADIVGECACYDSEKGWQCGDGCITIYETGKLETVSEHNCADGFTDYCEHSDGLVWRLMSDIELLDGVTLVKVTLGEICDYESKSDAEKAAYAAEETDKAVSCAIYLAFEDAIVNAGRNGQPVTLESIMNLGGLSADLFSNVMADFTANIGSNGTEYIEAAAAVVANVAGQNVEDIKALALGGDSAIETAAAMTALEALRQIGAETALTNYHNGSIDEMIAYHSNTSGSGHSGGELCVGEYIPAYQTALEQARAAYNGAVDSVNTLCMLLALPETLSTSLKNDESLAGLLGLFSRCVVGNGLGGHPSQAGHDSLYASVSECYGSYTAKDETIKNVNILLNELYDLVQTYGPEVAAQVWAQWEEYGYVDMVETTMTDLKDMLTSRYTYYTETALPAIETAIEALSAEKDALNEELVALKAELEAKKAELEAAVNGIEIGSVHTPDIDIDTGDLGNNEGTEVPDHDCVVDGESVEAELEAAVKDLEHAIAVIEALISDIEADIADMIAFAQQIAAAVAELEKTMSDVAAAVEDLEAAVNTLISIIKNSDGVVDQLVNSFEAARDTANAAVEVLNLTIGTAETMMADIDTMIEKIAADAEALYNKFMAELPGCIDAIPDEAKMLIAGSVLAVQQAYEANKEEINNALTAELTKLAEEYGINEETIKAELETLAKEYETNKAAFEEELDVIEAQIQAEVDAKYAEIKADYDAQIQAAKDEANAKLTALEEELKGYQAELEALAEDAAEEVRAELQKQIDRVIADMETVNADLACAIEHLENAALIAYNEIAAEVSKAYDEIVADVMQKLADLEMSYNEAVKALTAKLAELEAAYNEIVAILAEIDAKIAELIGEKYDEIRTAIDAQIEALKEEAAKKLAELEAELKVWMDKLENLGPDALDEIRQEIQAEIDRITAEIEAVKQGLADAIEELENAAKEAYEQIIAEVNKVYEEAIAALEQKLAELEAACNEVKAAIDEILAQAEAAYNEAVAALNQKLAELKAAYDKAVKDLTDAADQAIAELTEKLNQQLAELGKIGETLAEGVNGILAAIRQELADTQKAVEEILKGNLAAVEDLKNALIGMGGEAIVDAVDALIEAVMALIEEATTADLVIDDDFKYVAIGDGSAAAESYVEKLADALDAEAAENGVDEIEHVNYAFVGNTVTAERESLSDVTGADLITVGFSNVEFLSDAVNNAIEGVEMDWAAVVGAENVHYVDELLAEVAEKITEAGIEGDYAVMANAVIESYAYSAVLYATELPELINDIHAVNPDALVIIVGMYNPLEDVIISLGDNATMDIGEYVEYLVDGVAVHGIAYSILTGNSIYVDAPAVETENTDTELGIFDLMVMIMNGFKTMYPSADGDDYIASEIANALNITYVKSEPDVLYGDVNLDGVVDQSDVTLLFAYVLDSESLNEQQLLNADVNFDDMVDQSDLTKLFSYVLGQIDSL